MKAKKIFLSFLLAAMLAFGTGLLASAGWHLIRHGSFVADLHVGVFLSLSLGFIVATREWLVQCKGVL